MVDVSVVVPTCNRSALLGTTLRTVLAQRGVDLEVIVVDDASTEDPTPVLTGLGDPRLRLLRHELGLGPNAARNSGARLARGGWVAFVDDDDLWAPDKLAKQLEAAERSGRDWVYAGSVNVNGRLEIIHGRRPPSPPEVLDALWGYNAIPASASNVAVRRTAFASHGGFNEDLRTCEEWDLWLRLARASGPPAWVPEPLVAYRMHPGSATLDVSAIVRGARTIEQLHDIAVDWGRFHWWIAQLCLRSGRRVDALGHYLRAAVRGHWREARADVAALARGTLRRRLGRPALPTARRADVDWEDQARGWVEELRQAQAATVGGDR